MLHLIFTLNFYIFLTRYTRGCVITVNSYLDEYFYAYKYSDNAMSIEDCCTYCIDFLSKDARIYAFNNVHACFCTNKRYYSIGSTSDPSYAYGFYWRPPVNYPVPATPDNWTIGSTNTVFVTFREYKGTNDQMKIFTFNNMSSPNVNSGQMIVESTAEHDDTAVPTERKFERNEVTKLNNSIIETFESVSHRIFGHYALTFTVTDMGADNQSDVWFASIYSNDAFAVIDFKPFPVTRPSSNCSVVVLKHDGATVMNGDYVVSLSMKTSVDCNKDVEHVNLLLANEDILEGYDVTYEDLSIEATNVVFSAHQVNIVFDRLYMRSLIDMKIHLRVKKTVSRKTVMISNLFYTEFQNNISSVKSEKKIFTTYTNLRYGIGFYLLSSDTSKCLNTNPSKDRLVLDIICSYFKAIPHNLLHESGKCARVTVSETILEDCNKTKRLDITEKRITLKNGQQMAHSSTTAGSTIVSATADSTGTGLNRTYDIPNSGKFKLKYEQPVSSHPSLRDITILTSGKQLFVCSNTPRQSRCINYNSNLKRISKYTPQLRNIIAYDNITDMVFGRDMNGHNVIIKKKNNEKKLFYTSPTTWKRLLNASNVVASKYYNYSDLATAPKINETALGPVTYDVTYYGLMNTSDDDYFILWIADNECKHFAGKSDILALRTCIEIKNYCPQVKSGFFYIYGIVNKETKSKVYCDMETDNGGWIVIANYTVRNGVHRDITNNQTDVLNDVAASGFTKYLSGSPGFHNVFSYIGVKQIRFYCYTDKPGRTLHTRYLYSSKTNPLFNWMRELTGQRDTVCDHFQMYPDDTSVLSQSCDEWGDSGGGLYGDAGRQSYHLYQYPFQISTKEGWYIGYDNTNVCDEYSEKSNLVTYGDWIIYVR